MCILVCLNTLSYRYVRFMLTRFFTCNERFDKIINRYKTTRTGQTLAQINACICCVRLISRLEVGHFHALYVSYRNEFLGPMQVVQQPTWKKNKTLDRQLQPTLAYCDNVTDAAVTSQEYSYILNYILLSLSHRQSVYIVCNDINHRRVYKTMLSDNTCPRCVFTDVQYLSSRCDCNNITTDDLHII